jgi:hypothetical protein
MTIKFGHPSGGVSNTVTFYDVSTTTWVLTSTDGIITDFASECFLDGTKIITENGIKNIEEIKKGDKVKSFGVLGDDTFSTVVRIEIKESDSYLIINEHLKVTGNHHLYVNDKWIEAAYVEIGDYFRNSKKEKVPIFSIQKKRLDEFVKVYNLELDKYSTHNYFADDMLVHNKCPFVYSVNEEGSLNYENTILYNLNSKEKETYQQRLLKTITNKFLIKEIEDEVSYIKDIYLITNSETVLKLKNKWDTEYLILNNGDSFFAEFEEIPEGTLYICIVAFGYYEVKDK